MAHQVEVSDPLFEILGADVVHRVQQPHLGARGVGDGAGHLAVRQLDVKHDGDPVLLHLVDQESDRLGIWLRLVGAAGERRIIFQAELAAEIQEGEAVADDDLAALRALDQFAEIIVKPAQLLKIHGGAAGVLGLVLGIQLSSHFAELLHDLDRTCSSSSGSSPSW